MELNKQIIFPVISGLLLIVKDAFHIQVPADLANTITDVVLGVYTICGVFMHPSKPDVPAAPKPPTQP